MRELGARFPEHLNYAVIYDVTPFIRESVSEVFHTLRDAIILVAIVVLFFLQDWRAVMLPLIDVGVSLVGTFAMVHWMGFSLNNLTLFGLVLAIGIVDPREFDVPPIGFVTFSDPSTGSTREVMVTGDVQRRFAERAATERANREQTVRASGSDWLELSTDGDWLSQIAAHVRRRRLRPAMVHR